VEGYQNAFAGFDRAQDISGGIHKYYPSITLVLDL